MLLCFQSQPLNSGSFTGHALSLYFLSPDTLDFHFLCICVCICVRMHTYMHVHLYGYSGVNDNVLHRLTYGPQFMVLSGKVSQVWPCWRMYIMEGRL